MLDVKSARFADPFLRTWGVPFTRESDGGEFAALITRADAIDSSPGSLRQVGNYEIRTRADAGIGRGDVVVGAGGVRYRIQYSEDDERGMLRHIAARAV